MRYSILDRLLFAILRAMRAFGGSKAFDVLCFFAAFAMLVTPFVLAYLGIAPGWERP